MFVSPLSASRLSFGGLLWILAPLFVFGWVVDACASAPASRPSPTSAPRLAPTMASSPSSAPVCEVQGSAIAVARDTCRYGLPVRFGRDLLLPKVCRIQMSKESVALRHAVEVLSAATGRRRGQASLPSRLAPSTTPLPKLGTLIAGAIPLYVWEGGIAAIQTASRRALVVFEPTGRLAGVAAHAEVLAVVDVLPAEATFPKGSLEWTVLDFGSSALLGQARLAGSVLDLVGFEAKGKALMATLGRRKGSEMRLLRAPIYDAAGKVVSKRGQLKPAMKVEAKALAKKAAVGHGCPVLTATREALVGRAPVVVWDKGLRFGAPQVESARRLAGAPEGCLVAVAPNQRGETWAWINRGKRRALYHLRCK